MVGGEAVITSHGLRYGHVASDGGSLRSGGGLRAVHLLLHLPVTLAQVKHLNTAKQRARTDSQNEPKQTLAT